MKELAFLTVGLIIGAALGTAAAKQNQSARVIDSLLREREESAKQSA